jgi:hypothetical protein
MALMLSIMAGMLHDMLYSFGRRASSSNAFAPITVASASRS